MTNPTEEVEAAIQDMEDCRMFAGVARFILGGLSGLPGSMEDIGEQYSMLVRIEEILMSSFSMAEATTRIEDEGLQTGAYALVQTAALLQDTGRLEAILAAEGEDGWL